LITHDINTFHSNRIPESWICGTVGFAPLDLHVPRFAQRPQVAGFPEHEPEAAGVTTGAEATAVANFFTLATNSGTFAPVIVSTTFPSC
jgi:hypothetical protein